MPAFRAVCTDGSTFDLREQEGKTVVINLWATWCAPCVKELPNFERLQKERPEEVAVLALHSPPVTTDVEKWLSGFGCDIPFAVDADGSLSAALNASDVLPQTVIIAARKDRTSRRVRKKIADRNGIITIFVEVRKEAFVVSIMVIPYISVV